MSLLIPVIAALLGLCSAQGAPSHPHIVFVYADDLGFNDVSYQAVDSLVETPHIDALAASGVKLTNCYVQPVCSPSRVALLTGRYPYNIGVLGLFGGKETACMPFVGLLPETLKTFGYQNYLIGKWHLGFCKTDCLPASRGFDKFSGFYNGAQDYYTHYAGGGYDWKVQNSSGTFTMWEYENIYGVDLLDNEITATIGSHNKDTPMFLYYAMQLPHIPPQARAADEAHFSSIADETRRTYLAMVKALDDSMNVLVTALKDAGMFDDTIIIFSSDNGGQPTQGASNWPYSGSKGGYYEGGIKAAAFVAGKGLQVTNVVNNGLIHAVDWFPTIVSAIGETVPSGLDGVNQWNMISQNGASARNVIVHQIDTTSDPGKRAKGVIRKDEMKLISITSNKHERTAPPESSETDETGLDTSGTQLYNLTADPYERVNLAQNSEYRSYKRDLLNLLDTYRDAEGVVPSIHVESDSDIVNIDAEGALSSDWC